MTDMNNLADKLQPGIRLAQSKLQEVHEYLDAMGPTLRNYSDWQPIETAPKDGTAILIYENSGWRKLIYVVEWVGGVWLEADGEGYSTYDPTHWMPLPEPPKENE